MSSYRLMFLELGVLWYSQVLDLSLLPLVFILILTVVSRLLHLKTPVQEESFPCSLTCPLAGGFPQLLERGSLLWTGCGSWLPSEQASTQKSQPSLDGKGH